MTRKERDFFIAQQNAIIQRKKAFSESIKKAEANLVDSVRRSLRGKSVRNARTKDGDAFPVWIIGVSFDDKVNLRCMTSDGSNKYITLHNVSTIEE